MSRAPAADAVAADVGVMDGRADIADQPLVPEDRAEAR